MHEYEMVLGGKRRTARERRTILNPYTGAEVATIPLAGEQDVEDAIASAEAAFAETRCLPAYRRSEILLKLRDGVQTRREALARTIAEQAGKPIADSRTEVDRAINVLTLASEEAKRIGGETLPLDLNAASVGRFGMTRRFALGPVTAISPFNFPLNLGLHKVAPAIACGNTVIWKPSLLAPGPAYMFAEIAAESGLPPGALGVITPEDALAEKLVTDPRVRVVSFTGSARVGWRLRSLAGAKRVTLELGGNAVVLIAADADQEFAVRRCVIGGFSYAGQVCISVQRILIEERIYQEFVGRLVPAVKALRVGDPLDESTQVGSMISDREALRVERWLQEAVDGGAKLLTGGRRNGRMFEPTVLADARPDMNVSCQEMFGPVVTVASFSRWDEALSAANDTPYGLQAGIFTREIGRILQAFELLEVGGLIVNDVPTYRMDSMPYGGEKESGLGREGIRYAIEGMTALRLMVLNPV